MNKSDSIKQLAIALNKFQSEVSNPKKTETNPFHGSKYAPLSSVIDQVKPVLDKHGLCFSQLVSGDGSKSSVTTLLMHESGEWIESEPLTFPNQISKGDSAAQGGGSSITYARRYSLEAILGISSEDDNDGNPNDNQNSYDKNKGNINKHNSDPGEYVIPFGKSKGTKLKDADDSTLNWAKGIKPTNKKGEQLKEMATKYLKMRSGPSNKKSNNNSKKRKLSDREKEISELVDGIKELGQLVVNYLKHNFPEGSNGRKKITVDDLDKKSYEILVETLKNAHEENLEPPDNIDEEDLLPDDFEVPF